MPPAGSSGNVSASRVEGAVQSAMVTTVANTGRRTAAELATMIAIVATNDPYEPWHAEQAAKAKCAADISTGIERTSGLQVALPDGVKNGAAEVGNEPGGGRNERERWKGVRQRYGDRGEGRGRDGTSWHSSDDRRRGGGRYQRDD